MIDAACADLPLLHADVEDPGSLREIAVATKVVITTVGPYIRYGEPLVAACATAGTDYVDLTGEPEFVDRMWLEHHARAEQSGARLVHSCGFDSIPYDLGVQFTVEQLPEGVPISIDGFMRTKARSRVARTTRRSRSSAGCGRARSSRANGAGSRATLRAGGSAASPASRMPTSSRAGGSPRSRRSIR